MAITSGFFNSMNRDRRYNAEQMSQIFNGIITDGVFDNIGELFMTVPGTGLEVLVKSGRAWFDGTWTYNNDWYSLKIEEADISLPRRDAIVLEVNFSDDVRRNSLKIVTGTPSSSIPKPELTNTDKIHQHVLAYVTVRPSAISITPADIENVVGTEECPFVTGILETASIDDLYQQWEYQFQEWFKDVQSSLDSDTAGKLLNMINQRVKIEDVASREDILAGTDNNKWVSAYSVGDSIGRIRSGDMTSYIDVRTRLYEYVRKKRLYQTISLADNDTDITLTNPYTIFLREDGIYCIVFQRVSDIDKKLIYIYKYGFEEVNGYTEYYKEEVEIPASYIGNFRPNLSNMLQSNCLDIWPVSDGLFFDFSRKKIIRAPLINTNQWGANFVTANYYGYCSYNNASNSYKLFYCKIDEYQNVNSYLNKEFPLSDPIGKNASLIGVYEDIIWFSTASDHVTGKKRQIIFHKLDMSTQTFYEKNIVLDFSSSLEPEDTGVLTCHPLYNDERYTYFLTSVTNNTGNRVNAFKFKTRCLRLDRYTGETNYEAVLASTFVGGDVFRSIPTLTYLGNDDENAYCYVETIYALYKDFYLIKIDEETLNVSFSSIEYISEGNINTYLYGNDKLRSGVYYRSIPTTGVYNGGSSTSYKMQLALNKIRSYNTNDGYMAVLTPHAFLDVKASEGHLILSDLLETTYASDNEITLYNTINYSLRGFGIPAGFNILFYSRNTSLQYTIDGKTYSPFVHSDEFLYEVLKYGSEE